MWLERNPTWLWLQRDLFRRGNSIRVPQCRVKRSATSLTRGVTYMICLQSSANYHSEVSEGDSFRISSLQMRVDMRILLSCRNCIGDSLRIIESTGTGHLDAENVTLMMVGSSPWSSEASSWWRFHDDGCRWSSARRIRNWGKSPRWGKSPLVDLRSGISAITALMLDLCHRIYNQHLW